jgi:hypothetical protein
MTWRFLTGIAIAGSYMPGLKALTDRLPEGPIGGRPQAFYSATFSLASAASLFLAGCLTQTFGWPAAFALTGITALTRGGPDGAAAGQAPRPSPTAGSMTTRIAAVLKRPADDALHRGLCRPSWEMFAFRTWIVAFLTFAAFRAAPAAARSW